MSYGPIKRKFYMDNYYDDLKNRAKDYRLRFSRTPKQAAVRMIWWNFKSLFKHHVVKPQPVFEGHADRTGREGAYEEYVRYLEEQKAGYGDTFVDICQDCYERRAQDTKVIAWYLPQYYHIDVNDKYHGRGFTEWTNTTQAMPLYTGHYQPHIPYDVGYYDLTNLETMKRQVELAKKYGVYGFCFHWYWFSGERTMEKPVEMYLQHPELDLPFCFNWANERWTSAWDGENQNVIFEQRLDEADDQRFIADLMPYFKDRRYIKVDGRPLLSIYYCTTFDQDRFVSFLDHCRQAAKKEGFPDLYVMLTTGNDFNSDPREWGADALVEYPTLVMGAADRSEISGYLNPAFQGSILDYPSLAENGRFMRQLHSREYYRSAMVGFDNSARKAKMKNCLIMDRANPDSYKVWMKRVIEESKQIHSQDKNMVFVLAWNEWAEAAHLEPDMKFGYGFLQATREAVEETRTLDENVILEKIAEKQARGVSQIHFYVHCIESLGDIIACEPIARYLKQAVPNCKVSWMVKESYQDIVNYNPYIDEVVKVDCLGTAIQLCQRYKTQDDSIVIDCHYDKRWCVKTGLVHHNLNNPMVNEQTYFRYGALLPCFCLSAGLPALDMAPVFHEAPDAALVRELPERFVVVHCTAAEDCKAWDRDKWIELTQLLIQRGYAVVEIGLAPVVQSASPQYFDCTDVNRFQQIAQIVKRASGFIGIDSAFAHLANCYGIPGILIYGRYKNFNHYNPYTGVYGSGEGATMVFADNNELAREVRVEQVVSAFDARMGEGAGTV